MTHHIMDELIVKGIASLGSAGLVALVLWHIAKRFMDETVKQMNARIESLEHAADECAKDRRLMHAEIVDLARRLRPE